MPLYRATLQALGAAALLALTLACGGKNGSSATLDRINVGGTITYQRVPLATDANGVPTGLVDASVASNLKTLPARGVKVRIYQHREQTNPDGTKTLVWVRVNEGTTDTSGTYLLTAPVGHPTMVEVLSSFSGGDSYQIDVIGDPAGINSTNPIVDRPRYVLRKALDGTAPAGVNAPSSTSAANATVDFSVGLNDAWWLATPTTITLIAGESLAPTVDQAVLETSISGRTAGQGSGSRILGIGDTVATFVNTYGSATPGGYLDLHYWPGRSEAKGSFIEYDRTTYPLAYDVNTTSYHFFGSLQGGSANDDAWDEGVILPLLARNRLWNATGLRTYSVPLSRLLPVATPLTDLSPDMARIEGMAPAMAANLLKSPYLADTQGTGLAAPVQDVRSLAGLGAAQLTPYSAPAIRALTWEVILKANSLPSPGTAANWANINPLAAARFFAVPSSLTNGQSGSAARDIEPINIFTQLGRLKEGKASTEPVDLAAIFPDATLTTLATPFGIPWPRPTTGAYAAFAADWGTDPNGLTTPLAPFTLSMAKAVQVNGSYPNLSQGEVFYTGFSLNADKRYVLQATIAPALASGAQVVVDLPQMPRTFTFTGTGGSTEAITIPVTNTAPFYHAVRVRLKSPSAVQPDVAVTLSFQPSL